MALSKGRKAKGGGTRRKAKGKGQKGSPLEAEMLRQMREAGLPEPIREYRILPPRRFRADFAWPDLRVMLEVEGGIWQGRFGRHTSPAGYTADSEKYSLAAIAGWMVIRVTQPMIKSGMALSLIEKALEARVA